MAEKFADAAPKYEEILRTLGFTTPFFVSLTILGCKGTVVYVDPGSVRAYVQNYPRCAESVRAYVQN